MNLQQIETFVCVAETGSFSKAAMLLDIAQPALSRQVRALEAGMAEKSAEFLAQGARVYRQS